jgi:hypothetical protein
MTLDYCIFCFEEYSKEENTFNKIYKQILNVNNNSFYDFIKNNINIVKNQNFVIHCNHNYHLGCFVKYHKYKCDDKCNCIGNCNLPCPLCTIPIKSLDLQKAFREIYKLYSILDILTIKLKKLYIEIKIKKFILCCKKKFVKIKLNEIYQFNKLDIIYDDLYEIKTNLKKYIRNYINFCQV